MIWTKRLFLPALLPVNFLVLFVQANSFCNVDENHQLCGRHPIFSKQKERTQKERKEMLAAPALRPRATLALTVSSLAVLFAHLMI